jgi:hypothetical protein
MIRYTSEKQLSIEEFKTPFHAKLLESNRWVQLSKEFTPHPVFDPTLFVDIRKRVGHKMFDTLNADLIKSVSEKKDKRHNKKKKKDDSDEPKNKGKMQPMPL